MKSCPNCGLEPVPSYMANCDDDRYWDVLDEYCSCELCDICGEDTYRGMASCACERRMSEEDGQEITRKNSREMVEEQDGRRDDDNT